MDFGGKRDYKNDSSLLTFLTFETVSGGYNLDTPRIYHSGGQWPTIFVDLIHRSQEGL